MNNEGEVQLTLSIVPKILDRLVKKVGINIDVSVYGYLII